MSNIVSVFASVDPDLPAYGDFFTSVLNDSDLALNVKINTQAMQELMQDSKYIADDLEFIINGFERDIRSVSQVIGIKRLLIQVDKECELVDIEIEKRCYPIDKTLYWEGVYEYFLRFYNQNPEDIDLVRVFAPNGNVVVGVALGEEDTSDYKGDKSWFRDVMNSSLVEANDVYISPVSIARRTDSPAIRYVMPIDAENKRLGLVVINFKASAIYNPLLRRVYKDGDSDKWMILVDKAYENAEGDISDWVVTLADTQKPQYILDESKHAASFITVPQLNGNQGYLEFSKDGKHYVAAYYKVDIKEREWYILNVIPKESVYKVTSEEGYLQSEKIMFWMFGILVFLSLILFILINRNIIRFKKNVILFLLPLFLTLIIGLFLLNTFQITQTMKNDRMDSAVDYLSSIATLRANSVEYLVASEKHKLEITATSGSLTNAEVKKIVEDSDTIYELFLLDSEGNIILSSDESNIGLDKSTDVYFINARDKTYVKPVYYSETIKNEIFTVSTPFDDGVLVARLSLEPISNLFMNSIHLGETGESLLAYRDDSGHAKFFTQRRFVTAFPNRIPTNDPTKAIVQALSNNEIVMLEHYDYRNVPVVAITRYIDELDVGFVTKMDRQEIIEQISESLNRIWYFTVGMVIALIVIGFVFNFILTKSLKKEVSDKTKEINNVNVGLEKTVQERTKELQILNQNLEKEVKKRTHELQLKLKELEKFNKFTVDRELKMVVLKKEIAELKKKKK